MRRVGLAKAFAQQVAGIIVLFAVSGTLAAVENVFSAAVESIRVEELRRHVGTLADDSFEGREAGTRGGQAAAAYLMKKLDALGLRGGGDRGGFFQDFNNHRNVLAVLEGSDPELKHEYIIIGAHYDHVGYGTQKTSYGPLGHIHNGADDNASGTSAVLEVAEAFTKLPIAPRRSIIFAFWDGEEKGLLGSAHWVKNPTVSLDKVKIKLNADMVGRLRDNKLVVYGTRTAPGLRQLVSEANETSQLKLSYVWWINPRSDHYNFYLNKIPTLLFHTDLHEDYHRPTDDTEKIEFDGLQRITQLIFFTANDIANRDGLAEFRTAALSESSPQRRDFESPLPPLAPRFGITWNEDASPEKPGVTLLRVTKDAPAAKAGLAPGDRLVKFAGEEIISGSQLRALVVTAPNEVEIEVQPVGKTKSNLATVSLAGEPVRLGISWRESDAEPGAVTVVRVVPDSPAALAGIERLDRIYQIAGHAFANSEEFQRIASAHHEPFELLVEREGQLLTVKLSPPKKPLSSSN